MIGSTVYAALLTLVRAVVGSYFKRITVRNLERIPSSGPLLVIANHPATLSEVFLLGTRLGRRFHFLAGSFIFTPWIRGVIARACGALPVYRRQDHPDLTYRNEEVFRECHGLFDRNGAVVIFPEGESLTDRRILPLKTGAARLALGYESLPGRKGTLSVVPVGVFFSDRMQFQSDVVLSVGERLDLAPFLSRGEQDPQGAVRALTEVMQRSLEALILNVPNDVIAEFVHDVERLYLEDLRERRPGEEDLELLRRMASCILYFQKADPERVYSGWRRTLAYRRKLEALGLARADVRQQADRRAAMRSSLRLLIGGLLGAVPAAAGLILNYVPYRLTNLIALATTPRAVLFSATRIVAGAVIFPLAYALTGAALRFGAGWSWPVIAGVLALSIPLGFFAYLYFRWIARERATLHMAVIAWRNRHLLGRLRAERKDLIRMFDAARRDYLEAVGEEAPTPAPAL